MNKKITLKDTVNRLKPIIKWTGGKRREIKKFESYFPSFVNNDSIYNYVEPFIGGGAVYFYLNNINGNNVINDFDSLLCGFYKVFCQKNESDIKFITEIKRIGNITDHNSLEAEYYRLRNQDKNNGLEKLSDVDKAIRFYVVNQLAFSGMRRFNSSGEFNVPFGHYKRLNIKFIESIPHRSLLTKTNIFIGDFEPVMKDNDKENTFIFLDPPYTRIFKEYTSGNSFMENDHKRLGETIKSIKNASVMMIIDKSEFTEKLYKGMIKGTYCLNYGINIKKRFSTAAEHLIICNY